METERLWFGFCIGFICIGLLGMGGSPLHPYCSELPLYRVFPSRPVITWRDCEEPGEPEGRIMAEAELQIALKRNDSLWPRRAEGVRPDSFPNVNNFCIFLHFIQTNGHYHIRNCRSTTVRRLFDPQGSVFLHRSDSLPVCYRSSGLCYGSLLRLLTSLLRML